MPYRQVLPQAFFVLALLYIAMVFSFPPSQMGGDAFGYDPGGRAIPLLAGFILAATSLYLAVRDRHAARTEGTRGRALYLANVLLAVLFIALFLPLGFVLTTGIYMFALIVLNYREAGQQFTARGLSIWLAYSFTLLVGLYSLARGTIVLCFILAEAEGWDFLTDPFIQAVLETAVMIPVFIVAGMLVRRWSDRTPYLTISQCAVGTTMSIFILFRELFLVQLPNGLLFW